MAKAVIVSAQALEGIDAQSGSELLLAEDGRQFTNLISQELNQKSEKIGVAARKKVIARYNWDSNLEKVDALLEHTRFNRLDTHTLK